VWLVSLGMACELGHTDPTSPVTTPSEHVNTWTVYPDADDDGFGSPAVSHEITADEPGWVNNASDCDDTDPTVNPSGLDRCQHNRAIDGDCDGWEHPDDGSEVCHAEDGCPQYADIDNDDFGGALVITYEELECWFPDDAPFLVERSGDCDDSDPTVTPYAPETCDTIDNNCNDVIDEGC
jgi:hypothetical protein